MQESASVVQAFGGDGGLDAHPAEPLKQPARDVWPPARLSRSRSCSLAKRKLSAAARARQVKDSESKHNGYEVFSPATIDPGARVRCKGNSCLSTNDALDQFASMLPKAMGFHPWPFLFFAFPYMNSVTEPWRGWSRYGTRQRRGFDRPRKQAPLVPFGRIWHRSSPICAIDDSCGRHKIRRFRKRPPPRRR